MNTTYAKETTTLGKCTVGSFCCVKYAEDDTWYRAKIVGLKDSKVHIHYIDFGNYDVTTPAEVKELKDEFNNQSVFSVQCTLNTAHSDSEEHTDKFWELTEDKEFQVTVKSHQANKAVVQLVNQDKKYLTALLMEAVPSMSPSSPTQSGESVFVYF